MSASILVTYATRYGSTQETAEKIATTLREVEFSVDVAPMRQVDSIEGYQAIVLGAPIEMGKWHRDAHHFLSQYRQALTNVPVAVFALGPLHRDEKELRDAQTQLDKDLAKYSWLRPRTVQLFVGRFDPTKLPFPASLFMGKIPATDEMDWEAIRSWAAGLTAVLALEPSNKKAVPQTV